MFDLTGNSARGQLMPGLKVKANKIVFFLGLALFSCLASAEAAKKNYPPIAGTIIPSSGSSHANQPATFITTYFDRDNWKDLISVQFLVNTSPSGKNCFLAYYDPRNKKLFLRDDENKKWLGGYRPGTRAYIENSYSRLDCSKTAVYASGTSLIIRWSVIFKNTFGGKKNSYLFARDEHGGTSGWVLRGRWNIIASVLSISVNPKDWNIGQANPASILTMPPAKKITVTNDGSGPETFELKLVNPPGWTASSSPGRELYVLSGIFCNVNDVPQAANFNQDTSEDDVVAVSSKKATTIIFGYSQGMANGVAVPKGGVRGLYLQFKSPVITEKKLEQSINVIVSCQEP